MNRLSLYLFISTAHSSFMHMIAICQETNTLYTLHFKILKGYVFLDFLLTLTSNAFFDFFFLSTLREIISSKPNYASFKHVSVFHFNPKNAMA